MRKGLSFEWMWAFNKPSPQPFRAAAPGAKRVEPEARTAELPDPTNPPPGCAFAARGPRASDRCREEPPALHGPEDGTLAACFHPLDDREPSPALAA